MAQHQQIVSNNGAILQTYNNEMVKCIEDLCSRRDELRRQIELDQEEKVKLHNDVRIITDKLAKINEAIAQKMASQNEFDRAICETQTAYSRVMETSQSLLKTLHGATTKLKISEPEATSDFKLPKTGARRDLTHNK